MKVRTIKYLTILSILLITCFDAYSFSLKKKQAPLIDYNSWILSQSLPSESDGIKQFYPTSETIFNGEETDTIAVIRGEVKLKGLTAEQILLSSLVYAQEHFDIDEEEGFESIDYDNMECTLALKTTKGSNSAETTFTRNLYLKASEGILDFSVYDIECKYREKGLIPRTLNLKNLHPDTNSRHEQLLLDLVSLNSKYIHELSEYIISRKDISSPNFEMLKQNKDVIPGMNKDEVTILIGSPLNKRKSGEKERWIYGNEFVVIFENGVVSKVVR